MVDDYYYKFQVQQSTNDFYCNIFGANLVSAVNFI